jgi:uncharacterized protein YbjT (DUF2867 family)
MIVVTSATGNVGRPLVDLLAAAGEEVVAVSRSPRTQPPAAGVRWVPGDVGTAASLRPALDNADAVFVLLPGPLNNRGESPQVLMDVIARAGTKRIVFVSSQLAGTRPTSPSHARLAAYEEAVRGTGRDFTILRPCGFDSNVLGWADPIRGQRMVFAPYGDVALPSVDPADVAAVAATVLREDGHTGRTYELTGPELISPRRQAEVIARALGDELTFVEVSREDARTAMLQFMAAEMADGSLDALAEPLPAEQRISPDVQAVLHRPAGTFERWLARNLQAFR